MITNYLIVLGTSMLPLAELRGAIPIGIIGFDLNWLWVYVMAVVGNMLPVFVLPVLWRKIENKFVNRFALIGKIIHWLFERTRNRFYSKYRRFGNIALVLFVAVPLPVTGAWSGTIAAWLFGIPYKKTIGLIFVGVLISGIIVTAITKGIVRFAL